MSPASDNAPPRWLALVPLALTLLTLHAKWQTNLMGEMLWSCHVSLIGLSVVCALQNLKWIRSFALLTLVSTLFWFVDLALGHPDMVSWVTHIVGAVMACWLLWRYPEREGIPLWRRAAVVGLLVQQCAWLFTAPELNVNCAFGFHQGLHYTWGAPHLEALAVWLLDTALLWGGERILRLLWRTPGQSGGYSAA